MSKMHKTLNEQELQELIWKRFGFDAYVKHNSYFDYYDWPWRPKMANVFDITIRPSKSGFPGINFSINSDAPDYTEAIKRKFASELALYKTRYINMLEAYEEMKDK